MSQDPSFVTAFPYNPDSSSYNTNSFNTTGPLNNNTNSLYSNSHCFNTNNTNITVTDARAEILTWLSPLEPHLRHSDLESRRVQTSLACFQFSSIRYHLVDFASLSSLHLLLRPSYSCLILGVTLHTRSSTNLFSLSLPEGPTLSTRVRE